ncbi:Glycerol-3-phosphate ABC transporter [Amycolatopsis camponoti]|uniref:Glycerol-3-phosphate ABC transporter n=1 Tax=Amycolatopsis camponoti TaxID=2606593 RepID=A0A6I8LRB0_9PSEU|nr:extracellular solute-binding protein [Amycolatopsis camponoti]VVJ20414.1 Glycerol-3-phosphate ABC transporter [Amycolatopsis camponoti]
MGTRTVVDVWLADLTFPNYMEPLLRLGEEFERRHPEYEIKIQSSNFRRMPQEIHEAALGGRRPAIAEYYYTATQIARDAVDRDGVPLFTPVERAVAGRTEILGEPVVTGDVIRPLRDFYSQDGELGSMPTVGTTSLLYTNKSVLDAAGVREIPRTWGELEAACAAVARLSGGPSHGVTWANHGIFFQQALGTQGALMVEPDNGRTARGTRISLAGKEMLTWVEWWQRLHAAGTYLYTGAVNDWLGTFQRFIGGQTAFRFSSCTDVRYTVAAAKDAGFDLVVSRLPYNEQVPFAGNVVAGTSLWLGAGLDPVVEEGALAFLQFVNNPRNAAEWHKISSFIPVTNAAIARLEDEGYFAEHPYHRVAPDQLHAGDGSLAARGPLLGDYGGIHDVLTAAMDDVLARGADPAERFRRAEADAQALLDAYVHDVTSGGPRGPHCFTVD